MPPALEASRDAICGNINRLFVRPDLQLHYTLTLRDFNPPRRNQIKPQ
jgi:hypothetical protein